jgi:uncharacterized membrane protein YdbT with pleckstrin-like domain
METDTTWLSLDPGEEIVWRGQPRLLRIASDVVTFVVWSVVAFVVAFVVTRVLTIPLPVPDLAVWGGAVAWTLLQAVSPVKSYLKTNNTDYVLTTENVYKKTGVWSENITRVGVDKIQNTQLRKDFFGNIFDYGTVLLSTAGGGGVELAIADLDDPDALRTALRRQMARASQQPRRDAGPGTGGVDPETAQALVDEARKLREAAETIERHVH